MTNGDTMVTTNYPGSTTKSFDINNAYFGCFLAPGSNAAAVCPIYLSCFDIYSVNFMS